ncbi:MAG: bifunctional lysylphosphatidylglycerol flippase/synthetase MprF [Desulfuromonadales bacterium]|nr:bifunctional lysylphosphatidylglycerol flippase/synthetase MprF [Desulfuromonadales bacterium]MBN2792225.1 bifunctional lysylphosphatidylglycerol flippase/synthetase MprF [Desulfuromonadales bacterium]
MTPKPSHSFFSLRRLLPILPLVLFPLALWALHRAAAQFHYHDILRYVHAVPLSDLILAGLLTIFSYLVMTGYDLLAVLYLRQPLQRGRVMLAAFISYAFSNNVGISLLTAGSIRYRLYSAWGLSAEQITKLVAFTVVTFWLGLLTAAGLVFSFQPLSVPVSSLLPVFSVRGAGVVFLLLTGGYLSFLALRSTPFQLRSWHFSLPTVRLGLAQMAVGTLDWCLAGSVLYVLLPEQLSFSLPQLLGIYFLAQVVALVSHVPGGLGVFESMILLFAPQSASAALLGSLLLFRGIYYLLPLALGTSLLAYTEFLQRKGTISRLSQAIGQWGAVLVPQLLALSTLIAGAILLMSGATPALPQRLHWLREIIPLPVVEFSHFLGSLAGVVLLLLARGIQRRLDAAYGLTIFFLIGGSLLSLFKGGDYEEALLLALMAVALLPCRHHFYRKSSLLAESFTPGWIVTILLVFGSSVWLGLFVNKHVAYRTDLWWHFALHADAPRFMRAAVGAGVLLLIFSLAKLLKPTVLRSFSVDEQSLDKARQIIAASPSTAANLALLGDKELLFDEQDRGFVMYGVEKNSWISMGDPVGPDEVARELAWQFRELAERYGGQPVFYEVSPQMLHVYLDMGLSLYKLGEEAKVPITDFSLSGSKKSGLRQTLRRMEREECSFEVIPADHVQSLLPELKRISDSWLNEKNSREKGFSLGFFDEGYLVQFPLAVVRKEREILAFANLWCGADKAELSIDLMRYLPQSPSGIMEYLFIQLILWGQKQNYQYFNLGMAPLSGFENRPFAPLWHRIGALVFRHGEHFYNFEGLRHYKNKFDPVWEPRYLACPGGLVLPRILTHTATLISGGIKGVFGK